MNEIYRFRRIENLLGQHQELVKQQIYFASPDQLNDPMEGYQDIFWKGDQVVWENFLINYLRCVSHIFFLYLLLGESKKLTPDDLPLYPYGIKQETPQSLAFFQKTKAAFFKHRFINTLPGVLADRTSPMRRRELSPYLSFVQHYAVNTVSDQYFQAGLSDKRLFYHDVPEMDKHLSRSHILVKLTNRLEKKLIGVTNSADLIFSIADQVRKQHSLAVKYNDMSSEHLNSNAYFLTMELPDIFLDKLEKIMFSDWYSASFLGNCTNSAIWGHYADNHRGACLIFSPDRIEEQITLNLTKVCDNSEAVSTSGLRPHYFQKIEYHNKHVEIDFFKSLGRAPLHTLNYLWYKNSSGKTSICAIDIDTDKWRKEYWENFKKAYSVKLEEWAYEEEYRLVINDILYEYTDPANRKLTYDFRQLKGIIFGMKMPLTDKRQIIKLIREKCAAQKREQFEFYEAYYNQSTGKIDRFKLDLFNKIL
ncbi:DUF2971 domain-containing protein [Mucilaginibacter rubeus]|uniref:DUF2971 domain-containing protein n=1 Tax=Mucilaginibacter rubeus TaxID=2027860 RepID=A0A5C1HWB7_9SPHI|nr:DUF2971 domain-containing protein [Mucilaginibacter rubeus]QEM09321.1 DUF2971 domain-containing protein [Mucilaginibacter rubeus]